ncbi:DUF5658 family protein [Chloroflexota bacterium]
MKKYSKAFKNYCAGNHQLRLLIGTLIALVVSDGLISRFLVTQGFGLEGNLLLQTWVIEEKFLVIKLVGALFAALVLWDIHKLNCRLAFISTLCLVISYTLIVFWNISIFLSVAAHAI